MQYSQAKRNIWNSSSGNQLRSPNSLTSRLWMIVTFILLTDTNTHAKYSTFSEDYEFDCQGHYSKLTYQDCQGNFFNTTGCYFLENFAQYRACASICNYLIVGSLDEEKCRLYCPGKKNSLFAACWTVLQFEAPKLYCSVLQTINMFFGVVSCQEDQVVCRVSAI